MDDVREAWEYQVRLMEQEAQLNPAGRAGTVRNG
jgi:hypothetical protein